MEDPEVFRPDGMFGIPPLFSVQEASESAIWTTSAHSSQHESSGSTLRFFCMSELFTLFKGAASRPVTEAHFGHLCMHSHSVSHYRKLMSIGEGWNKDQLVNRKHSLQAQLYSHHNSPVHLLSCWHGTNLPVNPIPYSHFCTRPKDRWSPSLRAGLTQKLKGAIQHFLVEYPDLRFGSSDLSSHKPSQWALEVIVWSSKQNNITRVKKRCILRPK